MLAGDFPDWVEGNGNLWYINYRAYENYRIKPFPGKVALFKAQEIQREYINKVYGWDYFAQGGVDIYHVPGNHNTIMDKINGPILAKSLQTCIDNKITEIKDRKA